MIHFPLTKHGALETWLAGEIAKLASTVSVAETGFLLLDAQLTDLETRCAATHDRTSKKTAGAKELGTKDR